MNGTVATAIITTCGSAIVAALVFLGARVTARSSKEAATQATAVDAQESAVQAWKELLKPYRDEVELVRGELNTVRGELERERRDRAAAQRVTAAEVEGLRERVGLLTLQIGEWKRVARVISKWAITLRDEVLRLGGTVPATPDELLTLQAIEDAES